MAASRGVPWLQVTRGSPERLRTRQARACVNPEVGAGERAPPASSSRPTNRIVPLSHPPPPPPSPGLAVSFSVTCSLALQGSGAITGLGGGGDVSHSATVTTELIRVIIIL